MTFGKKRLGLAMQPSCNMVESTLGAVTKSEVSSTNSVAISPTWNFSREKRTYLSGALMLPAGNATAIKRPLATFNIAAPAKSTVTVQEVQVALAPLCRFTEVCKVIVAKLLNASAV